MAKRTRVRVVCLLVVLGVLAASTATLSAESNRTYFTFSASVRMPGITLPPGTYIFDRPSPMLDPTLVRVMDRTTSKLYLIAYTRLVHRPGEGNLSSTIAMGEAPNGAPRPISMWFPKGNTLGHQFIYQTVAGSRKLVAGSC